VLIAQGNLKSLQADSADFRHLLEAYQQAQAGNGDGL